MKKAGFTFRLPREPPKPPQDHCYTAMEEQPLEEKPDVTDIYGRYGPWQRKMFIFAFLVSVFSAWNNLAMTFFAPNIDYWCSQPAPYPNVTSEWLNTSIVWDNVDGEMKPSRCERFQPMASSLGHNRTIVECTQWEFDHSFYTATVIDQWNLVCKEEWLISLSQSMYMAGYMTSMLIFGQLSDRFGRRPVVFLALSILLLSGFGCLQTSQFIVFTVLRFFVSLGVSGAGTTSFVILMEMVGPEYRTSLGLGFNFGWATGFILLPGLAWLIRHWFFLQLAITAPSVCLLVAYWLVPESPRWLLTNRKYDKAEDLVVNAARENGRDVTEALTLFKQLKEQGTKDDEKFIRANVLHLLQKPNMRKKTLNLFFCWFVNSFIYFGLSLNTNDLGGNPFINFFISGAIEFPAYIIAIFIMKRLGRRVPQMVVMVIGGIACILTIPIPDDLLWLRITLAMMGKFCVTASFGMIYVYSAEVFPTVVRNIGVGCSSTSARIGSMVAPFVKELGRATHPAVPFAVYGGLSIVSGLLILLLPETLGCKLPDTVEEGEEFGLTPALDSRIARNAKSIRIYKVKTESSEKITPEESSGL